MTHSQSSFKSQCDLQKEGKGNTTRSQVSLPKHRAGPQKLSLRFGKTTGRRSHWGPLGPCTPRPTLALQTGAPALALTVAFVSWGWGPADTHKSLFALDPKNREEMLSDDMWSIPPKLGSLKSLGVFWRTQLVRLPRWQ